MGNSVSNSAHVVKHVGLGTESRAKGLAISKEAISAFRDLGRNSPANVLASFWNN